jgi:zinc transporter 1
MLVFIVGLVGLGVNLIGLVLFAGHGHHHHGHSHGGHQHG